MTAPDPRLGNPEWLDSWTLGGGVRFELIEMATRRVFLCQSEATTAEVDAFEPPDGFTHSLVGATRADMGFFARSPGASADGPLETADLGGRRFSYVARPLSIDTLPSGAMVCTIDKHHTMLYRCGRTIDLLDFGDGTVAAPAWGSHDPSVELTNSMLADEWKLRRVNLTHDLLAMIPNPARVIMLDRAFGFHGPIDAALVERATRKVAT